MVGAMPCSSPKVRRLSRMRVSIDRCEERGDAGAFAFSRTRAFPTRRGISRNGLV